VVLGKNDSNENPMLNGSAAVDEPTIPTLDGIIPTFSQAGRIS